jgi:hypothetical protein
MNRKFLWLPRKVACHTEQELTTNGKQVFEVTVTRSSTLWLTTVFEKEGQLYWRYFYDRDEHKPEYVARRHVEFWIVSWPIVFAVFLLSLIAIGYLYQMSPENLRVDKNYLPLIPAGLVSFMIAFSCWMTDHALTNYSKFINREDITYLITVCYKDYNKRLTHKGFFLVALYLAITYLVVL